MKFDKTAYFDEMKDMIEKAAQRINAEKPDFLIYTASIWTDPDACVSSVNFDSKQNSDKKIKQSNEWSKKYYDEFIAKGDLEQAKLFEPRTGRNCNPADFELRDFAEIKNQSMPGHWKADSKGRCWDKLEPALKEVGDYAFERFDQLNIHPDFELSVNGKSDWYQFTWANNKS